MAYRYWSTQRPVAPGTFPKPNGNKVTFIHNFYKRTYWIPIERQAWGWIEYEKPLTEKEWRGYELIPNPGEGSSWAVFYREEMEHVEDDEVNLAYMLLPTEWLKARFDDLKDWEINHTADWNVGLYAEAEKDNVILSIYVEEKNKMNNTIKVKTKAGTLVATVSNDPNYPGIFIGLIPNGTDCWIDLVGAEAHPDENGDVRLYAWTNPYTDCVSDEHVIKREDIVKAMEIEEE